MKYAQFNNKSELNLSLKCRPSTSYSFTASPDIHVQKDRFSLSQREKTQFNYFNMFSNRDSKTKTLTESAFEKQSDVTLHVEKVELYMF